MPKSYSKFTFDDIRALGIEVVEGSLFEHTVIPEVQPGDLLQAVLKRNLNRKLRSEKAKSEFIIAPILAELEDRNKDQFAFYSGYKFRVDPQLGLNGFCDYIFSLKPRALNIEAPVFCIAEAKNDNFDDGIAQCVAEMYAAQLFNKQQNRSIDPIYGAVTFGFEWKFIRLSQKTAQVGVNVYYLNELPAILGVLQYIIDSSVENFKVLNPLV